jgi:hypothetical protein
MVFIPFVKLKFRTKLSSNIIFEKLDSIIELKKFSFFGGLGYEKSFRGELFENSFIMIRNILYRNSFIPIIKGKIFQENGNTIIDIFMRMYLFVIIFMGLWLGIPLILLFTNLFDLIINHNGSLLTSFSPMIFFIFGYIIMMAGFNYEYIKAQKILKELLNVEIISEKCTNGI